MYRAFFGLSDDPFRLTPDPRFVHLAEPHRHVLLTIVQGIFFRRGFILVTGPVGSGKTTLLHMALRFFSNQSYVKTPIVTAFIVNPTLSRDELLETLLDEFEVRCSSTSKPRRLAALHQSFLENQRQGGTTVLMVDEAHLLTPELFEEIRLLGNADSYQGHLLQIVLAGQTEMTLLLDRPEMRALKQRIASRCQLRSLNLTEVIEYVAERLRAAGLQGPPPFPLPALHDVYRFTSGVPRLVNLLCDSCLTIGAATNHREITREIVEEAANSLGLTRATVMEVPLANEAHKAPN